MPAGGEGGSAEDAGKLKEWTIREPRDDTSADTVVEKAPATSPGVVSPPTKKRRHEFFRTAARLVRLFALSKVLHIFN